MKLALIIVGILLLLFGLWLLSLRAKRKTKDFHGLTAWHYAHRGLHSKEAKIPENSLLAFRLALEKGYGAELDVHLTKDGKLAVMHDESLKRTAGVEKDICDCTAEELKSFRLEDTLEPIPMLEEVLSLYAGKAPLVVEIKACKGNQKELTKAVCEMLDRFPTLSYCIESFDPRVLMWLKKHRPEIIRGQLSCRIDSQRDGAPPVIAQLLTCLFFNFLTVPHFVAYRFEDRKNLALRLCAKVWGVQEFSWTIRTKEDGETALREGCAIIFEEFYPETRKESCTIS